MYREGKYLAEARQSVEYKKEGRQLAVNFDSWQWFVSKANKTQFTAMLCSMTYFRRASLS